METSTSAATRQHDVAIPMFGYKNHAGIHRAHGFIRGWTVTTASAHDGAQLRNVASQDNTALTVWADITYRSKVRSAVEHVLARQKDKMKLFVRTIGMGRAKVKIGMANIAYDMISYGWLTGKSRTA